MAQMGTDTALAKLILNRDLMDFDQIQACRELQATSSEPFSQIVVKQGYLTPGKIAELEEAIRRGTEIHTTPGFDVSTPLDGTGTRAPEPIGVGTKLGEIEIRRLLGQGGMGAVYLGYQAKLDREVAVKTISVNMANAQEYITRFEREAQTVAKLNHANVIQIYDIGDYQGQQYIIMEFVDGESLQDKIDRQRALPTREATSIILQVAKALEQAHAKGIYHRDIKPDNIFVSKEGEAKLGDFGIAKNVSQNTLTQAGSVMGTPYYMSPEQAQGEQLDHRADIYSLGATYYHVLTGDPPFKGENPMSILYKHIHEPLVFTPKITSALRPDVRKLLQKMMDKEREQRHLTTADLVGDLQGILQNIETGTVPAATMVSGAPQSAVHTGAQTRAQDSVSTQFPPIPAAQPTVAAQGPPEWLTWMGVGAIAVLALFLLFSFASNKDNNEKNKHVASKDSGDKDGAISDKKTGKKDGAEKKILPPLDEKNTPETNPTTDYGKSPDEKKQQTTKPEEKKNTGPVGGGDPLDKIIDEGLKKAKAAKEDVKKFLEGTPNPKEVADKVKEKQIQEILDRAAVKVNYKMHEGAMEEVLKALAVNPQHEEARKMAQDLSLKLFGQAIKKKNLDSAGKYGKLHREYGGNLDGTLKLLVGGLKIHSVGSVLEMAKKVMPTRREWRTITHQEAENRVDQVFDKATKDLQTKLYYSQTLLEKLGNQPQDQKILGPYIQELKDEIATTERKKAKVLKGIRQRLQRRDRMRRPRRNGRWRKNNGRQFRKN